MTAGAFGRCWEIWHTRKSKEQLLAENRKLRDELKHAGEDLDDTRYQLKLAVLAVDVVLDVARDMNKTVSARSMATDECYQKGFQAYLDASTK